MDGVRCSVIALSKATPRMVDMNGRQVRTAIVRDPTEEPLNFVADGPEGNETAVHTEHVLAFNAEHYDYWAGVLGVDRSCWNWAWFGENLTLSGQLNEETLRVGDVLRIGTAVFEVTSPRVPCFKVSWRVGQPEAFLPRMMESGRVGIHLAVLQQGIVRIGDDVEVVKSDPQSVTIADLSRVLLSISPDSLAVLEQTIAHPALGYKAAHSVRQRIALIKDRERMKLGRWRGWRAFTLARVRDEAAGIRSFFLTPQDNEPLAPPAAGQFLTVKLTLPDGGEIVRPWTISAADMDAREYRISVREIESGAGSTLLHRGLREGATIWARPPSGQFVLDRSGFRRIALISAGIGVTPMLPMLQSHLDRGDNAPPLLWLQIVRNGRHHPFREEVEKLLSRARLVERHIFYTQPDSDDRQGKDFDHVGRPSAEEMQKLLAAPYEVNPFGRPFDVPGKESEFYHCGPPSLSQVLSETFSRMGVKPGLVRSESFVAPRLPGAAPGSAEHAKVHFKASGLVVDWHADDNLSILDVAEAAGLSPPFACRTGVCHSCQCRLVSGSVQYSPVPQVQPEPGTVLICCASPTDAVIELDL